MDRNLPKFFIPESDDRVDPKFDFLTDSYSPDRSVPLKHDRYAHELMENPSFSGILITKSVIGATKERSILSSGGVHSYLRLPSDCPIMGDCGAFQYRNEEVPPYSPEEICEFYDRLGFNYGISLDHMVFEFDPSYDGGDLLGRMPSEEMVRRQEITIHNGREMASLCQSGNYGFHPIGAVQGWSPQSYYYCAKQLIDAGLDYLALGGLVRSSDEEIRSILDTLRPLVLKTNTQLHILGVARLSLLPDYATSNVASCDSASTLMQAFKSNKDNYHTSGRNYTAIRIPPASGDLSPKVRKLLKTTQENEGETAASKLHKRLIGLEQTALKSMRDYASRELDLEAVMNDLIAYEDEFGDERRYYSAFKETLQDRPWESCNCAVCHEIGIEVVIMRGNNRNRRRGFHNTAVFHHQFIKEIAKLRNIE